MHHGILLMFAIGQVIQIWQRAAEAVGSKYNGINSLAQYFQLRIQEVAGRFLLITCLFGGWESGELYGLIGYFAPTTGAALAAHPIPVSWWTAGLIGYFGDGIIYFFVGLAAKVWPNIRQDVPPDPLTKPTGSGTLLPNAESINAPIK